MTGELLCAARGDSYCNHGYPCPMTDALELAYTIDKGVPLPSPGRYPFAAMAVGDSFMFPREERHRVASAASDFGKAHGWKFSCRNVPGGTRCWRVE